MVRLFVTEKPSVARDLARALGIPTSTRGETCLRGERDWVTWCLGHLVEIAEPHEHDPQWKRWSPDSLPILPEEIRLRPIARTRSHLQAVGALLRDREVSEVINACDAGREGELIFRYVYQHARSRKPVRRLWLSSLTSQAIRAGLAQLRPGRALDPLGAAARCRAEADWLVGMNGTRAYTLRADGLLSLGRVQTPTLALIVAREEAIENFVPEPYWVVKAQLAAEGDEGPQRWEARWRDPRVRPPREQQGGARRERGDPKEAALAERLPSAEAAAAVVAAIQGQAGRVSEVVRREEQVPPPLLYNLTALQQEANRRFGLTAEATLKAAQELYERHKLLTYPRTESRHLTRDLAATTPGIVESLEGAFPEIVSPLLSGGLPRLSRRFVDDAQVGDHHALIPTGKEPRLEGLGRDVARVFDLVARRFLAAFHPAARYAKTRIDSEVAGHLLRAEGRVQLDPGWERADPPARKRGERLLPAVQRGQPCACEEASSEERATRPPRRYNEAGLLGAMERAGRRLEEWDAAGAEDSGEGPAEAGGLAGGGLGGGVGERELRAALRDQGLGTPATRAATIETLLRRRYLVRSGRNLVPSPTGRALIGGLPDGPASALKSARLTGEWEARLARVARGEADPERFRRDLRGFVADLVSCLGAISPVGLPEEARSRGRGGSRSGRGRSGLGRSRSGGGHSGGARSGGARSGARAGARREASRGRTRGSRSGGRSGGAAGSWEGARSRGGGAVASRSGSPRSSPGRSSSGRGSTGTGSTGTGSVGRGGSRVPSEAGAGRARRGPRCRMCREGEIVRGRRGWGCNRYRQGCRFVVWFHHEGVEIPPGEADRLFRRGKTRLFAAHPVSGRRARLVLSPDREGNVSWEETKRGRST